MKNNYKRYNPTLNAMKKVLNYLILTFLAGSFVFTSCSKDEDVVPPTISFKQATGYVSANTTAKYGDTLTFGVIAKSNGTDKLVKFQVLANSESIVDSTINTDDFTFDFYTLKSILDKETWKIVITDIAGNVDSTAVTITANFGEILSYNSITLGAQDNTVEKSFLSYSNSTATTYFQAEAYNHQADIDMFCFYENTPSHVNLMTLASPGSGISGIFTGSTAPENYTTQNTTYFVKTTLTTAQFDAVQNDAIILASFDPESKFRKAKLLTVGDVYAFKLASGKYGLYKVLAVEGTETGTLQIAVKIQK